MNGAKDSKGRTLRLPRLEISRTTLNAFALPALALGGLVAIIGVFLGVQCGGLDKCFAGKAAMVAPPVELAATAEQPVAEPRLAPQAQVATAPQPGPVVETPTASAVAMTKPPVATPEPTRAQRAEDMIGASFAAISSDDDGWLAGTYSAPGAEVAVEEGDGPGPLLPQDTPGGETAAQAVAEAVAVTPLERPKPLEVAAFVQEPAAVEPEVRAEAEQKLAEVADAKPKAEPEVATALAVEPEPVAEAKKPAEPVKKVASANGDIRTVGGSGVTVRSGPGKSNGRLFALAAGEKVTVLGNQRGWLKITDDQGRAGWLYKSYVN